MFETVMETVELVNAWKETFTHPLFVLLIIGVLAHRFRLQIAEILE